MNDLLVYDDDDEYLRVHQLTVDGVTFRMTLRYEDKYDWDGYTIRVWRFNADGDWTLIEDLYCDSTHHAHTPDKVWHSENLHEIAKLYWTWLLKDPLNWRVSAEMEGILT